MYTIEARFQEIEKENWRDESSLTGFTAPTNSLATYGALKM